MYPINYRHLLENIFFSNSNKIFTGYLFNLYYVQFYMIAGKMFIIQTQIEYLYCSFCFFSSSKCCKQYNSTSDCFHAVNSLMKSLWLYGRFDIFSVSGSHVIAIWNLTNIWTTYLRSMTFRTNVWLGFTFI